MYTVLSIHKKHTVDKNDAFQIGVNAVRRAEPGTIVRWIELDIRGVGGRWSNDCYVTYSQPVENSAKAFSQKELRDGLAKMRTDAAEMLSQLENK